MGIPKKKVENFAGARNIVKTIPIAVKSPGFFKLYMVLTVSSLGVYWFFSDYRKYIKNNILIKEIEGVRRNSNLQSTYAIDNPGTTKKFKDSYGLDFDTEKESKD
jgi:uncharacterized membrane protein